jgi:hypothetical protein
MTPTSPKILEKVLFVRIHRIPAELPHSSYEEGSRRAGRPSGPQSLTTLLTRLRLATTIRMEAFQVEFLCNGVCVSTFTVKGVFIGVSGTSTDLERSVWRQVVADRTSHVASRPGGAASTDFSHCLGLPLLM